MTAHETTNDCCRFTKGIISFPPEDWRTWLQRLLRINSNIWEDFWDSLLVNCYKQTLYMLGWLMKVILVIGYKLFTCPTGRCCCIVVVLSSLWNDLWLIVTGFSPQNCHQHLSSEMNQARKKLQRNITRILEPWLVSGDTLRAERRAPARVAKKKGSLDWVAIPRHVGLVRCVCFRRCSPLEGENFSLKCSKPTSRSRPCWRNTRQACLHHRCSILQNASTGMQQPGNDHGVFRTVCRRTMCVYIYK